MIFLNNDSFKPIFYRLHNLNDRTFHSNNKNFVLFYIWTTNKYYCRFKTSLANIDCQIQYLIILVFGLFAFTLSIYITIGVGHFR